MLRPIIARDHAQWLLYCTVHVYILHGLHCNDQLFFFWGGGGGRGQNNYNWQVEQKPGGGGRRREWATLGVHPLSWLLSNNWLEKVPFVSVPHTSSNRLLLSNQDKGCTPSVVHSLALPLGPALLNLWSTTFSPTVQCCSFIFNELCTWHSLANIFKTFVNAMYFHISKSHDTSTLSTCGDSIAIASFYVPKIPNLAKRM